MEPSTAHFSQIAKRPLSELYEGLRNTVSVKLHNNFAGHLIVTGSEYEAEFEAVLIDWSIGQCIVIVKVSFRYRSGSFSNIFLTYRAKSNASTSLTDA